MNQKYYSNSDDGNTETEKEWEEIKQKKLYKKLDNLDSIKTANKIDDAEKITHICGIGCTTKKKTSKMPL